MPRSQPNYLTTDANGLVQAIFSGGVLLPTPAQSLDDRGASVTWTDGAGGARLAQISTFKLGSPGPIGAGEIDVNAEQTDPTVQSEIRLTAKSATATGQVRIIGGAIGSPSQILANGRLVARSDGASDFVQLGVAGGTRRSMFAIPVFTWPGGGAGSNQLSPSAIAGFPVTAILSGGYDDNTGFQATVVSKPAADIMIAVATSAGSPISPAAGTRSQVPCLFIG